MCCCHAHLRRAPAHPLAAPDHIPLLLLLLLLLLL
jgi:hypothetical protein